MAHIGVAPGSKLTDAIRKVHADATREAAFIRAQLRAAGAARRRRRRRCQTPIRETPRGAPRPPEGGGARRGAVARFVLPSDCFLNFRLSVVGRRGAARSMTSVNRGEGARGFFVSSRRRRARRRRRERVSPGARGGRGASVLRRVRVLLFGVDVLLFGDVHDGDGFAVDHDAVVEPEDAAGRAGGRETRRDADARYSDIFYAVFSVDGWMGAHLTTTFCSGRVTTSPSKVTRPWRMKDLASERVHTPCLRGGVGDGRERRRWFVRVPRRGRTWQGPCRRVRAPRGRARVSCSYRARRSIRARRSYSP